MQFLHEGFGHSVTTTISLADFFFMTHRLIIKREGDGTKGATSRSSGGTNETEVKINRSWLAAYIEILGFSVQKKKYY
jgi:hypothetical protein